MRLKDIHLIAAPFVIKANEVLLAFFSMNKPSPSGYFIGGVLIALAGAICFSTKAIFVKLAYRDTGIDAITLLALRMLFSLPFFVVSATLASRKASNVKFTSNQ